MRHGDAAALAALGPAVAASHVGGRRGLVEEDNPFGIQVELPLEPVLARLHHVGTALLGGVQIPFFRLMPWRAKKRYSPLVLVVTPFSRKLSRNSRR